MTAPSGGFFPAGVSGGRGVSGLLFQRQRKASCGWNKNDAGGFCNLFVQLPKRSDVIQDPERAAVRGDNQVVAVNGQIAHRGVRQIQLQQLPGVAIVKGNIDRSLGTREEQALACGIFAHSIDRSVAG